MSEINTSNSRIAKNSIFLSIRMAIVLIINLYTTRVLLRTLGVVDYGVYNVVCGFVSMFTFLNTSMSNGIQRFYNYELGKNGSEGANKVYNTSLVIQIVLAGIILLLVETIGLWYLNNVMVIPDNRTFAAKCIFQISAMSFLFNILQAPYMAAVMAHERMDFFALMSVLDAVMKLIAVICLPFINADRLIMYALLMLLIPLINIVCYISYTRKRFQEIRISFNLNREMFKAMLSFSGWNIFGSFSSMMKDQGLNMIINLFFGPVVNAARGVAMQVNSGLQGFVQNLTIPVRPQVIQSYAQGNIDRTIKLTYSISKFSTFFLYALALPICYEIDFILSMWIGQDVPQYTNIFVVIIILLSFLNNLNSAISGVVHASGKMKRYQIETTLIALSALPITYFILANGGGVEWSILPALITMFFAQIASLFILKTIISFSIIDYLKEVVLPLVLIVALTILIPLIPLKLMSEGWLRLIVVVLMSVISVVVSCYTIGLNTSEKYLIKNLFSKIISKK